MAETLRKLTEGSTVEARHFIIDGQPVTLRLEAEIWTSLADICRHEHRTLGDVVRLVAGQVRCGSISGALRLFTLAHFVGRSRVV